MRLVCGCRDVHSHSLAATAAGGCVARGLDLSRVKQATARQGCITSRKLEPAGRRVAGGIALMLSEKRASQSRFDRKWCNASAFFQTILLV